MYIVRQLVFFGKEAIHKMVFLMPLYQTGPNKSMYPLTNNGALYQTKYANEKEYPGHIEPACKHQGWKPSCSITMLVLVVPYSRYLCECHK